MVRLTVFWPLRLAAETRVWMLVLLALLMVTEKPVPISVPFPVVTQVIVAAALERGLEFEIPSLHRRW